MCRQRKRPDKIQSERRLNAFNGFAPLCRASAPDVVHEDIQLSETFRHLCCEPNVLANQRRVREQQLNTVVTGTLPQLGNRFVTTRGISTSYQDVHARSREARSDMKTDPAGAPGDKSRPLRWL